MDLAILDIKLKHHDGVEVLHDTQRTRPELKVIMLTGYPTRLTATESSRIGADAHCIKPIGRHGLESIVSYLLLQPSVGSA